MVYKLTYRAKKGEYAIVENSIGHVFYRPPEFRSHHQRMFRTYAEAEQCIHELFPRVRRGKPQKDGSVPYYSLNNKWMATIKWMGN